MEKAKYVVSRLVIITSVIAASIYSGWVIAQISVNYGANLHIIGAAVIGLAVLGFMGYWFSVDYDMKLNDPTKDQIR